MSRIARLLLTASAVLVLSLGGAAQEPESAGAFDPSHASWNRLLHDFVHPGGRVDYRGLMTRRGELDAYLASLQAVEPATFTAWKPAQREAFWINAYNAYTVRLILDHYPVESIKDLGGFFSSVFDKEFIPLRPLVGHGKGLLSLSELEHGVLAEISRRPFFHFAIVCASASCPELRNEAYVGDRLDAQLDDQARRFLADPSKNEQTLHDGGLRVSKIFDWSEDELERYPGGIRALLAAYGPPAVAQAPGLKRVRLSYLKYDWSLNEWIPPTSKN